MKNKRAFRATIIVAMLSLIGITSFLGFYFFNMRDLDFMLGKIRISENSSVNYTVNLKDEDYKKDNKTDKYVTNLIKTVNTSFNYNVAFNEDVVGDYTYNIVGRLQTLDERGNVLVNKKIYENAGIKNNVNGRVINLISSFDIKFSDYKNMYDALVKEYGINLDGEIVFDINIDYDVYNENIAKDVTGSDTLTVSIPLGKETTKIEIPDEVKVKRTEYRDAESEFTSTYFLVSIEFFGATLLFVLVLILIMKNFYGNMGNYERELARITSKYKGRLVKIRELPDLSKCDVLFVDDFDALDDASINIMTPINYVEVIKDKESVFIVFKDDKAYVYKLSKLIEDTL